MSITDVRGLCRAAEGHVEAGDLTKALPCAKEAVAISKAVLGATHYGYAMALCTLGWILSTMQITGIDCQDPQPVFLEVEERGRDLLSDDFNHGVVALLQSATFWEERGDAEKAIRLYQELLDAHADNLGLGEGAEHPRYYQIKSKLDRLGIMA